MEQSVCPFCAETDAVLVSELALARPDANPVTPGHLLVLTRRHVADFFDGFNVGEATGQTVPHVHIHLIPRYRGDTPHPRGGVRGVILDKQSY